MKINNVLFTALVLFWAYHSIVKAESLNDKWKNTIAYNMAHEEFVAEKFRHNDYSILINNFGSYAKLIGVFGNEFKRIDFYFVAQKEYENVYKIIGKNKLLNNIRPITGTIELLFGRKYKRENEEAQFRGTSTFELIFKYVFKEPNDKVGDGTFSGIVSFMDMLDDNTLKPNNVSFASDFAEFNNIYVGTWIDYKTNNEKNCIFSDRVCCVVTLPFVREIYEASNSDSPYPRLKKKYSTIFDKQYNEWWINK